MSLVRNQDHLYRCLRLGLREESQERDEGQEQPCRNAPPRTRKGAGGSGGRSGGPAADGAAHHREAQAPENAGQAALPSRSGAGRGSRWRRQRFDSHERVAVDELAFLAGSRDGWWACSFIGPRRINAQRGQSTMNHKRVAHFGASPTLGRYARPMFPRCGKGAGVCANFGFRCGYPVAPDCKSRMTRRGYYSPTGSAVRLRGRAAFR